MTGTKQKQITGKIKLKSKVASLSDQINLILKKCTQIHVSRPRVEDITFCFSKSKNVKDQRCCGICFLYKHVDRMFSFAGCQHSYCFSCMSKYVESLLLRRTTSTLKCPHENCKSESKIDSWKKLLSPKLFNIMSERVKEASIPVEDRFYCPYPKCSTLGSKNELQRSKCSSDVVSYQAIKCRKCSGIYCINCKVPWHTDMICSEFQRLNPNLNHEEKTLKCLATKMKWQQCPKCNHMVSLVSGCSHITCRCGHGFCYKCGAERGILRICNCGG